MQTTNGVIEVSEPLKEVIKQLNEPKTADALKNLAKNAEVLDALVSGLDGFLRRSDEIVENVGTSVREFMPQTNGNGKPQLMEEVPQLIGNLPTLAKTGNKLSQIAETKDFDDLLNQKNVGLLKELVGMLNDETVQALRETLKYAPVLAFLAKAANDFLARSSEIADNVGESVREFAPKFEGDSNGIAEIIGELPKVLPVLSKNLPAISENLPPLMEKAPNLIKTGLQLGEIAESDGVQAFLHSKMLTPELVEFLGDMGEVAVKTKEQFARNPRQVSVWGVYSELKDENVQRGVAFMLDLAKNLGKTIGK